MSAATILNTYVLLAGVRRALCVLSAALLVHSGSVAQAESLKLTVYSPNAACRAGNQLQLIAALSNAGDEPVNLVVDRWLWDVNLRLHLRRVSTGEEWPAMVVAKVDYEWHPSVRKLAPGDVVMVELLASDDLSPFRRKSPAGRFDLSLDYVIDDGALSRMFGSSVRLLEHYGRNLWHGAVTSNTIRVTFLRERAASSR